MLRTDTPAAGEHPVGRCSFVSYRGSLAEVFGVLMQIVGPCACPRCAWREAQDPARRMVLRLSDGRALEHVRRTSFRCGRCGRDGR